MANADGKIRMEKCGCGENANGKVRIEKTKNILKKITVKKVL